MQIIGVASACNKENEFVTNRKKVISIFKQLFGGHFELFLWQPVELVVQYDSF